MKRLLFISVLLMMTTVLFGQTVKIISNPIRPCAGDEVVFTAAFDSLGGRSNIEYRLYRDSERLAVIDVPHDTVTFDTVTTVPGNYYVRATYHGERYYSDTIALAALESEFYDTTCAGTPYEWNQMVCDTTGDYTWVYSSVVTGCDSTVTLHLTIFDPIEYSFDTTTCAGVPLEWNGQEYSEPGEYQYTYTAANGCDSLVTMHLKVLPVQTSIQKASICPGYSYTWNGHAYYEAGTYTATFTGVNGCDSIVTLELVFKQKVEIAISGDPSICHNNTSAYTVDEIDNASYDWVVTGGTVTGGEGTHSITVLWDGDKEGQVLVNVVNGDGCSDSDSMAVSVNSYVEKLNSIQVKKTKEGSQYMLIYKNPESGLKYQWYKDDEAIEGATGQYYMVEEGLPTGIYKVYVSHNVDSDGNLFCGAYTEAVEIGTQKAAFSIFPNPAGEGSELFLDGIYESVTVTIYSIDGRMIRQFKTETNGKLPISLSNGCYFVEIMDVNHNKQVEKLIIK